MTSRRHFGSVRKRSSGKWQATYRHEGSLYSVGTFAAKADALAYLSSIESDLRRGAWIDPRSGKVTLRDYANEWIGQRSDLAVRTTELYAYLLRQHVNPALGDVYLSALVPSGIRGWHAELSSRHPSTAAKCYRLLSSILRTAVTDGLILSSPCKVDGAGIERPLERPIATLAEIESLTLAMPEHLRLLVPLATWCQLRRGEFLGLRRKDIDALHLKIRVEQSRTFTMEGRSIVKQPKTAAGHRNLAVPPFLMIQIVDHLERFTGGTPDSLVFTGKTGVLLMRNVLQTSWARARLSVGRKDLHLHDLRHTGLTLAAATGATTAELMHRAGHSSAAAALRYQHATQDRDRVLADALEVLVKPSEVTPLLKERRATN
jgi:integrase